VLLAAGVVVGLVFTPTAGASHLGPVPLAGPDVCAAQVTISMRAADGDAPARRVAAGLQGDRRFWAVAVETQQQSYVHFEREFADLPEPAKLGRPQALPAVVWLLPAPGINHDKLAAQYPTADDVRAGNGPCWTRLDVAGYPRGQDF
jgi:hypothetical protein